MAFKCDYYKRNGDTCNRKPYVEVFVPSTEEEDGYWAYLCFWHYLKERILKLFGKSRNDFGWCKVDTNREMLENIMEEIWGIQYDLMEIKEKLGIKEDYKELIKWDEEEKDVA